MLRLWGRAKQDLAEELDSHLQLAIADRIARGEEPTKARFAALRELGNVTLIQDVTRAQWGGLWLENLLYDGRHAFRQLLRSPAFSATALLTLSFGIGVNLGVFQLLYAVVAAQLPVPRPAEIVRVHAALSPFDQSWTISYPAYQRLRESTPDVPLIATAPSDKVTFQVPNRLSSKTPSESVSDNYFSGLGVAPAAGRVFVEADGRLNQGEWPVVLRYAFARNTFGSAAQAVGQHVRINGKSFQIIGVAGRRFLGDVTGHAPDLWFPLALQSTGAFTIPWDSLGPNHDVALDKPWYNQSTVFWLFLTARIPTARRASVLAHWDQVFRQDREIMTQATADQAARADALHTQTTLVPFSQNGMRSRFASPLTLLMALSASIFLVGCLNLANLQLARLAARAPELGVRLALGASRSRLIRQIVLEDAMLVGAGAAGAALLGRTASSLLLRWAANRNTLYTLDLRPNWPLVGLWAGLMFLAFVAFSLVPALLSIRSSTSRAAGSRAKVAGMIQSSQQRLRANVLLGSQVSLSLLLSTLSVCFAGTLIHWETIDVGMDREHVLIVHPEFHEPRYADHPEQLLHLYQRIKERLDSLPGVRSTAFEMCGDLHCGWSTAIYVHGRSDLTNGQVHGQEDHVGLGFFSTLGISFLRGRDFNSSDTATGQRVAILSHAYARQLFGDTDPVGQRVGYGPAPNDNRFLIVGEVADARVNGAQNEGPAVVYMDLNQSPQPVNSIRLRTYGDPRELSEIVRRALLEIDPTLPVGEIISLAEDMDGDLGTQTLLARLAGIYSALTLVLVAIGFYGVMASRTRLRSKEFGIRLALGATREHIQMLVLSQAGFVLLGGILPGIILSFFAVRTTSSLLYGTVLANAPATLAASLLLAIAGMAATLVPARRAAFADPVKTLHEN